MQMLDGQLTAAKHTLTGEIMHETTLRLLGKCSPIHPCMYDSPQKPNCHSCMLPNTWRALTSKAPIALPCAFVHRCLLALDHLVWSVHPRLYYLVVLPQQACQPTLSSGHMGYLFLDARLP